MTTWVHRNIIVPASLALPARNLAECLTPAAAGMFITPVSPTGDGDPTHFISSGLVDEQFMALLSDPAALYAACQQGAQAQGMTLTATLADAEALVAQANVSEENPFGALIRVGLKILSGEES